jgi:16S rRNA (cytosine967-C5)-methyltransferase
LRVVVFELIGPAGQPAPIIVDTGVRAASQLDRRYGGFANAVLRRAAEHGSWPPPYTPAERGIPDWLDRSVRPTFGEVGGDADALWAASDENAAVGLRWAEPINGGVAVEGILDAQLWSDGPPPAGIPIQDPASIAVGNLVGAEPGMRVLDLAAAPGGKAAHLLDQVGSSGRVVATDSHPRRAGTGRRRVPGAAWVVADGRRPPFGAGSFDRVLLDAPCSGLGTLRRHPEIRYRVTPAGVLRLAGVQKALLDSALRLAAPGGRVVYSVCTMTLEETQQVVAGRGAHPPDGLPGRPYGDGWLMTPDTGPVDGMFMAVIDL